MRVRLLALAATAAFLVLIVAGSTAATFELRVLSQTNNRITLGWDAQQNVAAYVFYANGQRVSHTFDGTRTSVTFAKVDPCSTPCYEVDDLISDGKAGYPVAAPPPPPPPPPPPSPPPPPPSGWPNADNTGVPAGTVLTPRSGGFSVNQAGAVIDAIDHTSGCIDVYAPGVTIKNSKLRCIIIRDAAENPANPRLTVQDSEIVCPIGTWNTGIVFSNYNAIRLDVSGCENGFDASRDVTIRDSYIHDLAQCKTSGCIEPDLHTDGIQGNPFANVLIEHNTIYAFTLPCIWPGGGTCNGTSAVMTNGAGHGANTTVRNNLLAGGAATLYCPKDTQPSFRVLDNHFSTIYKSTVGEFSPIDSCEGETLSGNVCHETGAAITQSSSSTVCAGAPTPPPPPPAPAGTVSQTIVDGSTIANITGWRATYDANGDGTEDDPGSIQFLVDGVQILSEINAPFGDTFATGSPSVAPGQHTFRVNATSDAGAALATNTVTATIGTAPAPPPPPAPTGCALPAFPDASCTGVPAGTTLTPSGGLTISTAGTVIDGREITGQVVVNAANVTIRNSRIRSNAMWVIDNNSTGLVVEDSEIINRPVSGEPNCHNGIGNANFTVRRTEITGCENAANIGGDNVVMTDNYIHDLDTVGPSYVWGNSPHTDGLQMSPGADNIVVRHNWIDPSPGGGVTAPIIMGINGSQANVWIEDNYLDGRNASYALYANRSASTNININRNRMLKGYGYTACVRLGVTVTSFIDNRDAATGALLAPDNGSDGGCTN